MAQAVGVQVPPIAPIFDALIFNIDSLLVLVKGKFDNRSLI